MARNDSAVVIDDEGVNEPQRADCLAQLADLARQVATGLSVLGAIASRVTYLMLRALVMLDTFIGPGRPRHGIGVLGAPGQFPEHPASCGTADVFLNPINNPYKSDSVQTLRIRAISLRPVLSPVPENRPRSTFQTSSSTPSSAISSRRITGVNPAVLNCSSLAS